MTGPNPTTTTVPHDPEDRDTTAGEFVLGTLAPDEHAAVAHALEHDADLRAAVYAWQDRLLGLLHPRVAPVDAPAALWHGIDERLGPHVSPVSTTAPQAEAMAMGRAGASNEDLFRRLRRWQWTGGLALAASVLFASLLLLRLAAPVPVETRYIAVLQSPADRSTGWVVDVAGGNRVRLLPFAPTEGAPAGRTLQLWTQAEGAAGPRSLGLVRANEAFEVPASVLSAVGARQLFALSLEPEGGSPTGKPTGPIVFAGNAVGL